MGLDAHFQEIIRQFLGHPLGHGSDQAALVLFGTALNLIQQVVNLSFSWLDFHRGFQKTGWAPIARPPVYFVCIRIPQVWLTHRSPD
jgi:hypothetical protein